MGGQPYLYNPPVRYSVVDPYNNFNPKAVTQASFSPPRTSRPKQEGPYLNFNRHPDTYVVLPGPPNVAPLRSGTKTTVRWSRKTQQVFRLLQLLGSLVALFCAVALRGVPLTAGWIIRLPVGHQLCMSS